MKLLQNLSEEELKRIAWQTGKLDYLVKDYQEPVWSRFCELVGRFDVTDETLQNAIDARELVVNVSRRWGKTTLGFLLLVVLCIENPKHTYYFVAPTAGDASDIIRYTASVIFQDCPEDLRPSEIGGRFTFKNGSVIKIGGVWQGARTLRGRTANGTFIDEAAFIPQLNAASCLQYVLSSCIQPMISTTNGWKIISSTPPPNMKHDYISIYRQAQADNRLINLTIYDNSDFTIERIEAEKLISYRTDPSGTAWRREFLAELIPASNDLIIVPEAAAVIDYNIYERPDRFDLVHRYIVIDHGTKDLTACLFGYYDFASARAVIEKELLIPQKSTTDQIAAYILKQKVELWGSHNVFRSVADAISHQLIIDINDKLYEHGIQFVHPSKLDLEAMVNQLTISLMDRKIAIHPDCKLLIDTINTGTWKINQGNGKRDFARLNDIGHCDFLAALNYFNRALIKNMNPYASIKPTQTQWSNPYAPKQDNQHTALVKALIGPSRAFRR